MSLLCFLAIALAATAFAKTWHILEDGTGTVPTIQEAVDQSWTGDTVIVWPGTYYENLNIDNKDLVLQSKGGADATTLDGSKSGSVIVIRGGVTSAAKVCGFRIVNGTGFAWFGTISKEGGGIYVGRSWPRICHNQFVGNEARSGGALVVRTEEETTPLPEIVVESNLFEGNRATQNGGAIRLANVNARISDNVFLYNVAAFDGGAVDDRSGVSVSYVGNYFAYNHATDKGGGMNLTSGGAPGSIIVANNTLTSNTSLGLDMFDSGSGGGVRIGGRTGIVRNNTIVFNDGRSLSNASGGGISLGWEVQDLEIANNIIAYNRGSGIACFDLAHPEAIDLKSNLFWQNEQGAIGTLLKPCPAHWNLPVWEVDPQFCDWKNGDFTVATTSPAINTGAIYGAYPDPHCGIVVQTEQTTWGRLKVMFGSEN